MVAATAVGIERLGIHVPRWRLARADHGTCWSIGAAAGQRTVASWDEDTVTMAVDAATRVLQPGSEDAASVDTVLFASTTPVFLERQNAGVVAAALGITARRTLDLTGSVRAGLDALRLACDLVRSGASTRALVVAADRRDLPPGSRLEQLSGDVGAAMLVSASPDVLAVTGHDEVADPGFSLWRCDGDAGVSVGDERFITTTLLNPWLVAASTAALAGAGASTDMIAAAVLAAPLPGCGAAVAKALGLPATVLRAARTIADEVGMAGAAAPFVELAALLADSTTGETVLIGAAADGASAVVGTVGARTGQQAVTDLGQVLATGRALDAGRWLRFRGQVPTAPIDPSTSETLLHREQDTVFGLTGSRCGSCGRVDYPPRRVCVACHAKDQGVPAPLQRTGTLHTYTVEHLFPVPEGRLIMGVVDLGDARFYTQITDTDADECRIGLPVELVLRRLHAGSGMPHYFWKARVTMEARSAD